MVSVGKETLKPFREKRKPQLTAEILNLMGERQKRETKDLNIYTEVQRNIQKKRFENKTRGSYPSNVTE